ncbi:hypothetical protein WJX81_001008 [Elliptochloris bilobata]|uniref:Splicing factor YJU2 n=1 Tax=Elliptochloris bilobata TaxID=381761 RepID=A0AAW1QY31_9CHLO
MGERKVLIKYFPPDFDPSKLPRGKRPDNNMMKVRMMLPMSVRCSTCGTYMYKGTKFNTRKEDVEGEDYLGIQVFRFYFRCSACAAELTMKTDPANSDYTMERGGTRNYEPWRDKERTVAEAIAAREEEEKGNAMKALENRTLDSKREMDIMNALDEMQSLNKRHERVDTAAALAALQRSADSEQVELDAEDEAAIRAMLAQRASAAPVRPRLLAVPVKRKAEPGSGGGAGEAGSGEAKRPALNDRGEGGEVKQAEMSSEGGGALLGGLLGGYGSSNSEGST